MNRKRIRIVVGSYEGRLLEPHEIVASVRAKLMPRRSIVRIAPARRARICKQDN